MYIYLLIPVPFLVQQDILMEKLRKCKDVRKLSEAKQQLIQVRTKYFANEIEFKQQENIISLERLSEKFKSVKLRNEIKELDKRIKEEKLRKLMNN